MFCQNCGKEIPDGSKFCPECGASISTPKEEVKEESKVEEKPTLKEPKPVNEKRKGFSALSIIGFIISFFGIFGFIGAIIGIVELIINKKNKRGLSIAAIVIGLLMTIMFSTPTTDSKKSEQPVQPVAGIEASSAYSSSEQTSPVESSTEEVAEPATTEPSEDNVSENDFKKSCKEIEYDKYARNADKYVGKPVKVTAQVFQVVKGGESDGYDHYFKVFTDDGSGTYSQDLIYIADYRDENAVDYTKLLEGDIVTIYGTFGGTVTTTDMVTGMNGEDISIDAKYIELKPDSE
jgi:rRNA maturation endonuclease Nob1